MDWINEDERQARRIAVAAIAKLSIAYGKEMEDAQIDLYINALHDLSGSLDRAVDRIISTERYFPAIATIREAALRDDTRLSPEEAWGFVTRVIQMIGSKASTRGFNLETKAAIDACGGFQVLCSSENRTGDRITFVNAYKAYLERVDRRRAEAWRVPESIREGLEQNRILDEGK